ncbi:efflux RND transporter periplasmic adaptor subunit [Thiotrichales bacterium 19S3-7]|nr:efflux RND transporter periplasmic adaptor subunit [Thiotrichales bacterium 19S3-7]MCF6801722.1 efflux RND transporter periplasmic adaptor subunit [Thiotrichales bacterium 19S3-11]
MRYMTIKQRNYLLSLMTSFFMATTISHANTNTPISVNVATAKVITVPDEIKAVGHIQAIQQVNLSFGNDGKLMEKYFNNGDRVLKGEVIAKLDTTQDEADLESLQAKLNIAQQTYQRMQILAKSGAVSKETLDQKKAILVEAKTEIDKQKNELQNDILVAPFSGVLSSFIYDVGAYITSGTTLVQLTQQAPVKVEFSLPANLKPELALGDQVLVNSSTYPKRTFHGVVSYLSPTINSATGTIALEAKIPNQDYLLTPGMFVSVSQLINSNRKILTVPDTAVQADQNGQFVYVVNKDNTVEKVYIKQGLVRDDWAQILHGISPGTVVVSIGAFKLTDGNHIIISKIAPPPSNQRTLLPHIQHNLPDTTPNSKNDVQTEKPTDQMTTQQLNQKN